MKYCIRPGFFNFNYRSSGFKPSKVAPSDYRYNCVENILNYLQKYWTLNYEKASLKTAHCDGGPITESEWEYLIYYGYLEHAIMEDLLKANKEWLEINKKILYFQMVSLILTHKKNIKLENTLTDLCRKRRH